MNYIINKEDFIIFEPLLFQLKEKNINVKEGFYLTEDKDNYYLTFNKDYLSDCNYSILQVITTIYSDISFYTSNFQKPMEDKISWLQSIQNNCKNKDNIGNDCLQKDGITFRLSKEDKIKALGTSLMLSDILKMQNPFNISEEGFYYEKEKLIQFENYILQNKPDKLPYILSVTLNRGNPLRENNYAQIFTTAIINSKEKKIPNNIENNEHLTFCLENDLIENTIIKYFVTSKDEETKTKILEILSNSTTKEKTTTKILKYYRNNF